MIIHVSHQQLIKVRPAVDNGRCTPPIYNDAEIIVLISTLLNTSQMDLSPFNYCNCALSNLWISI